MTTPETVYRLIGKGNSGWHAAGTCSTGKVSCSSYNVGEDQLAKFAAEAADGALVYDASRADHAALVRFVVSGPMCDTTLPDDGVDAFGDVGREAAARMLPALGGAFKTLAAMAVADRKFSGFDKVGLSVYEALLRRDVPGVRIGRVRSGAVIWEDR